MTTAKKSNTAEIIQNLRASTSQNKDKGIGFVWNTTTNSIGKVASVVGSVATAAEVFSKQAVTQAAISRIESSKEMCETLGMQTEDPFETLALAQALTDYIVNQ